MSYTYQYRAQRPGRVVVGGWEVIDMPTFILVRPCQFHYSFIAYIGSVSNDGVNFSDSRAD